MNTSILKLKATVIRPKDDDELDGLAASISFPVECDDEAIGEALGDHDLMAYVVGELHDLVVRIVRMDNMALESDLTVQYRNFLEYASDSCGMGYPYLGVMETPMYFHPVTEAEILPTLPITSDLCNMPLTPDYTNKFEPDLVCRHLRIENGVIDFTKGEYFRCYGYSECAG